MTLTQSRVILACQSSTTSMKPHSFFADLFPFPIFLIDGLAQAAVSWSPPSIT